MKSTLTSLTSLASLLTMLLLIFVMGVPLLISHLFSRKSREDFNGRADKPQYQLPKEWVEENL